MKRKLVALLPMKANSERVRGKNFREFCGKPLFRWMLETLLEVEDVEQIVINTDAQSILEEHGVSTNDRILVRERKPEICGDLVSMNKVLEDDVLNTDADDFLMTHVTNPLVTKATIMKALDEYYQGGQSGSCDSLFSVNRVQTRFYREDGSPVNHDPSNLVRTQDLEPWYEENSNLYIFSRQSFMKTHARIGANPAMFISNPIESIDIDEPQDWDMAVITAEYMKQKGFLQ